MKKIPPGTYNASISSCVKENGKLKVSFTLTDPEFKGVSVGGFYLPTNQKLKKKWRDK